MDIVIPFWNDRHKDTELKYALRSIEKYLTGFGNIWVIGEKTALNTKFLPCQNISGRKEFSIAEKILVACKCDRISDPFIMWHDDHFLLKPLDVSEIKYWYDGTLEEVKKNPTSKSGYKTAIKNTIEAGCGKNFDIHTPIIFKKERFIERVTKADWQPNKEFCVKSLYCNGFEGYQMTDLKINTPAYQPFLIKKIHDRLFFSTGPLGLQPEMIELLNELYPVPSKYEKA